MLILSALMAYRGKKAKTSHFNAWKDDHYETYRINQPIPAARLHLVSGKAMGRWFAVDTYHVSIKSYHDKLALVDKTGKATTFSSPALDIYLLIPGTIVNVGLARSQGAHAGGGWQFEFVDGPAPLLIEHINKPGLVEM